MSVDQRPLADAVADADAHSAQARWRAGAAWCMPSSDGHCGSILLRVPLPWCSVRC